MFCRMYTKTLRIEVHFEHSGLISVHGVSAPSSMERFFPKSLLVDLALLWLTTRELNQRKYSAPEETVVSKEFVLVDDM